MFPSKESVEIFVQYGTFLKRLIWRFDRRDLLHLIFRCTFAVGHIFLRIIIDCYDLTYARLDKISVAEPYFFTVPVPVPFRFRFRLRFLLRFLLHIWIIKSKFFKQNFGKILPFYIVNFSTRKQLISFIKIYCKMWMKKKKMLIEGNQIPYTILYCFCENFCDSILLQFLFRNCN